MRESWKRAVVPPRVPITKYIGSFSESGGSSPVVSACTASRRETATRSAFDARPARESVALPAKLVKHPRIGEAAASLECRVERRINFGPEREMVVGEILLIHARDGIIDPVSKRISEELYHPVGRLFATRYCKTRERFDLPGEIP